MNILEIIKIGSNILKNKNIPSHILDSELLKALKNLEEILINLNTINEKAFKI